MLPYQKIMTGDKPSCAACLLRCIVVTAFSAVLLYTQSGVQAATLPSATSATTITEIASEDVAWVALVDRLVTDGFDKARIEDLFNRMDGTYSSGPMEHKLRALFLRKFSPPPPVVSGKKKIVPSVYPGVLVPENLKRAKVFLQENKASLRRMEKRFGVPKEIAVGLMLVETRLGNYLGKEQAFHNLACLAASDSLEQLRPKLSDLAFTENREQWLAQRLEDKSSWAYTELKALITYCMKNGLDPISMPGSIYGAVGICQFMPSNILRFGVDGDGDGTVNLFHVQDAMHSLANYLKYHGWKPGITRSSQNKVLRHYNNSVTYANTILAVADALR